MTQIGFVGGIDQRKVKLTSGVNTVDLDFNGVQYTVAEVGDKMKEVLNLQGNEIALVNGRQVNPLEYVLNGTENVEFVREAGQKG